MQVSLLFAVAIVATLQQGKSDYLHMDDHTLSTIYAHDESTDEITRRCLEDMFPRSLYAYPVKIQSSDVPCILHCIFRRFGIMTADGSFNLKNYNYRVRAIHNNDPRVLIADDGETCVQAVETLELGNDMCKRAKAFNDCTQLYGVAFTA